MEDLKGIVSFLRSLRVESEELAEAPGVGRGQSREGNCRLYGIVEGSATVQELEKGGNLKGPPRFSSGPRL